jgi:hypothetical protein
MNSTVVTYSAAATLVVCTLVFAMPNRVFANDNCRKLEGLSQLYANVELSNNRKKLKRQLVAWYNRNCHGSESADAN